MTENEIEACITGEQYHQFPGTTLTVCCLHLMNGFVVTGESAALNPDDFDAGMGRRIARAKAREKIYQLEAYRCLDLQFRGAA